MYTPLILFLGDIGTSELVLIMVVILVFFGANKIPELARGLGKGIREFKDASTEIRREFEQAGQPAPPNSYGTQNQYSPPVPPAPVTEAGSGFDPWAAPATASLPTAAAPEQAFGLGSDDSEPPATHSLPPNLAPEGTRPRQPYTPPASPDPTPNA
ncbi:MAG TPA: twin-arginine translocase TatA/TatE family subunit [Hymenobacter sp.]|jgi:sec-independent protein translocase protein TatA